MQRKWKLFLIFGIVVLALDQVTKFWARGLPVDARGFGQAVPVIANYFDWRLSYNFGSAFSMFANLGGARIFLTIVGLIALVAVFFWVKQTRNDQTGASIGLGLIAGGAIGNLYDRITMGKVTDFIVWKYHQHEWPTFNIADAALCVGIGLLFIDSFRNKKAPAEVKQVA